MGGQTSPLQPKPGRGKGEKPSVSEGSCRQQTETYSLPEGGFNSS